VIVRLVAARVSTSRIRGLVVNFDLPLVAEDYKHRIDRTARAFASVATLKPPRVRAAPAPSR